MIRIALVGHSTNVHYMMKHIETKDKEVQLLPFHFNNLNQLDETITALNNFQESIQGIMYTGKVPYNLIHHNLRSTVPSAYIKHTISNLQRCLLEASLKMGYDIRSISIDSFDIDDIMATYGEIGLGPSDFTADLPPFDMNTQGLVDLLYNHHKISISLGTSTFAITGISAVHERLMDNQMPSILVRPTLDALSHSMDQVLLEIDANHHKANQIGVISIEIDMPSEYDMLLENEYQLLMEKTRVSEEVYKFARRIQGAVVESGTHNYMLFSTRKPITFETNNFEKVPLLDKVKQGTAHTISMGVGFGASAKEAKYMASIGLNKALKHGGNQAFIMGDKKVIGPIHPTRETNKSKQRTSEKGMLKISDQTGLSVNTIYKLMTIKQLSGKDLFTSIELAEAFGSSTRSMNRIINKLELSGYVKIEGKKVMSGAGRPSRILRLQL